LGNRECVNAGFASSFEGFLAAKKKSHGCRQMI
jgi:hypothetical protein